MDTTRPLDFPDASFDLVNARFMIGFLRPDLWPLLIQECRRITTSNGAIRLTEPDNLGTTSSPAFERMFAWTARAFQMTGRSFSPEGHDFGITPKLGYFLRQAGYHNIQQTAHVIDFSTGEEAHEGTYRDWMIGMKLLQPFWLSVKLTTQQEADEVYKQAMIEMRSPDFTALWYLLSVWGEKP